MGTTVDKLNKILQTKAAIKQSIIAKGVEIADSDSFSSYPTKIDSIETGSKGPTITAKNMLGEVPAKGTKIFLQPINQKAESLGQFKNGGKYNRYLLNTPMPRGMRYDTYNGWVASYISDNTSEEVYNTKGGITNGIYRTVPNQGVILGSVVAFEDTFIKINDPSGNKGFPLCSNLYFSKDSSSIYSMKDYKLEEKLADITDSYIKNAGLDNFVGLEGTDFVYFKYHTSLCKFKVNKQTKVLDLIDTWKIDDASLFSLSLDGSLLFCGYPEHCKAYYLEEGGKFTQISELNGYTGYYNSHNNIITLGYSGNTQPYRMFKYLGKGKIEEIPLDLSWVTVTDYQFAPSVNADVSYINIPASYDNCYLAKLAKSEKGYKAIPLTRFNYTNANITSTVESATEQEVIAIVNNIETPSFAEYQYLDTQSEVVYPKKTMTADAWRASPMWFSGDLEGFKNSTADFSIYVQGGSQNEIANLFDNDSNTVVNLGYETSYGFGFKEPVAMKRIGVRARYLDTEIDFYGTDNPDYFGNTGNMEKLCSISFNDTTKIVYFDITATKPYRYYTYMQQGSGGTTGISEMRFDVVAGATTLTLKSANMTPLINYNITPAEVYTQPFYDGTKIVESKKLLFKPYDEGGALLDYVDDLEPVDLNLLLCSGSKDFPVFGNYDILGSMNVENGIASGFSESNGLLIRETVPQVNTLKMIIKGNSSNINHNNVLYCNYQGSEKYIAIHSNNKFAYYTGSWTDGTTTLRPSTEYWFAVEKKDTTFVGYLLEDKNYTLDRLPPFEQWSREWESTEDIFSGMRLSIGLNTSTVSEYFSGAIDLNGCKIDINGSTWWTPVSSYENRPATNYFLAKDENIALPTEYTDRLKVSTLNLPKRNKIVEYPKVAMNPNDENCFRR